MAQVMKGLPRKHKALSWVQSLVQGEKEKRKEGINTEEDPETMCFLN
jgi:hypothetical protein